MGSTTATGHEIKAGDLFVALPSTEALNRKVEVRNGDVTLTVPVLDVGPWNTNDPYWRNDRSGRPQAESGRDLSGRKTNGAGIDLSDSVYKQLGLKGIDPIDWRFVK